MSVFRNVRIYPKHGDREAAVTWELENGTPAGNVYLAFSPTGTKGSWEELNPNTPVASSLGFYQDPRLFMNKGSADGFYRLLLIANSTDFMSEPFQIMGDITRAEYGILRSIIHQEFTQMRVTNGFPVWHCIPREHGDPATTVDPDTGKQGGGECAILNPADRSYGLRFKGGFYTPILTWMRITAHSEGLKDDPDKFSPEDMLKTAARLMAFPRPARGHMIVDPTTDTRYLIGEEIKPYRLRGVMPVAYNVTLEHLNQSDERYQFELPVIDTKQYRRIPYWTPSTLTP
jgi:hypothetical protein